MRRFTITVKRGPETEARIEGRDGVADKITVGELGDKIIQAEIFLERLTGLRFHINLEE